MTTVITGGGGVLGYMGGVGRPDAILRSDGTSSTTSYERHGSPRFYELLEEVAELHSRKNHDYAQSSDPLSNLRLSGAFGISPWKGVLVRLSDKWSRMIQLSTGKQPKNESLRDTLIDMAVYSLLAILLLEEEK